MDKTCDECKATFATRTKSPSRERFCGKKCYQRFWNRHTNERLHPPRDLTRLCVSCGRGFLTDRQHPNAQTCSVACSQRRVQADKSAARAAIRDLSPRPCKECGTEFVPSKYSWRWRVFCSPKCASKATHREFKKRHPERVRENEKTQRNKRWNGNWFAALERDGHKCTLCAVAGVRLEVHHRDGSGEDDSPNHALGNLTTLCHTCHKRVHTLSWRIVNGKFYVSGPVLEWLRIRKVFVKKEKQ